MCRRRSGEREVLMQRLKQVFIETLGVPENTDFSQLAYGKDPLWDSVAHMNLVASLENTV